MIWCHFLQYLWIKTLKLPLALLGVSHLAFFSELCWGKATVACAKPQQRKQEESERLRGERDQVKFIDLRFESLQVVSFRKARGRQDAP